MKGKFLIMSVFALALALLLVVSGGSVVQAAAPALNPVCPQASLIGPALQGGDLPIKLFMPYTVQPCGGPPVDVPFYEPWAMSPHNDHDSEAFRHWDADGEIPEDCAKCHSTYGYEDFLGVDGSTEGIVDHPADIGSTIECVACHNTATLTKTSVTFPSGITIEHLKDESRCMECHQGRESGVSVDNAIANAGLTDDVDTVSPALRFLNVHYYAAAATQFGGLVIGGYQYEGMSYDVKFRHVESADQCYECHDMHSLEIDLNQCAECHNNVVDIEDIKDIREAGSLSDYDGDGNMTEGMWYELNGLEAMLYDAIQQYATQVSGTPIVYDASRYPYWFNDQGTGYASWTARLLKAAYNYQVVHKDPGGVAHNGKYLVELMHDSINDLNEVITPGVDMTTAERIDPGHFAGSQEAWRHWDGDDYIVPGSCSKCHSDEGIPFLKAEGVSVSQPAANGMQCTTCHDPEDWPNRYEFNDATFPSGATVSLAKGTDKDNNLCIQCHQGRSWGGAVDEATEGVGPDDLDPGQRFINIHYFAAGATLFGNVTNGIYQYEGETYVGQNKHPFGSSSFGTCIDCHATHELQVEYQACKSCHPSPPINSDADLVNIRWATTPDYDGDGNTTEGVFYEVAGMAEAVYAGMQTYSAANPVTDPIVFDAGRYPYFFNDQGEGYNTWTPRLLRAAYNYQYALKDPGAFAHNNKYVIQALYDNLADFDDSPYASGLTDGKIRPQ